MGRKQMEPATKSQRLQLTALNCQHSIIFRPTTQLHSWPILICCQASVCHVMYCSQTVQDRWLVCIEVE